MNVRTPEGQVRYVATQLKDMSMELQDLIWYVEYLIEQHYGKLKDPPDGTNVKEDE